MYINVMYEFNLRGVSHPRYLFVRICIHIRDANRYLIHFKIWVCFDCSRRNESILAVFVRRLSAWHSRSVYVQQTTDTLHCERARRQIKNVQNNSPPLPTLLTLITWVDTRSHTSATDTFQCVIATYEKDSYFIYNYLMLTHQFGAVGVVDGNCVKTISNVSTKTLKNTTKQYLINESSNSTSTSLSWTISLPIMIIVSILLISTNKLSCCNGTNENEFVNVSDMRKRTMRRCRWRHGSERYERKPTFHENQLRRKSISSRMLEKKRLHILQSISIVLKF